MLVALTLQCEAGVQHPRDHLAHHSLEFSSLTGPVGTTIAGDHLSYLSLRRHFFGKAAVDDTTEGIVRGRAGRRDEDRVAPCPFPRLGVLVNGGREVLPPVLGESRQGDQIPRSPAGTPQVETDVLHSLASPLGEWCRSEQP